jgi:hypothetical protein
MFERVLQNHEREKRFSIVQTGRYWEVLEEQDRQVVRRVSYDDWHRVERARRVFGLEADTLRRAGWVEVEAGRPV